MYELETYSTLILNEIRRLYVEDHVDHDEAVEIVKAAVMFNLAEKCADINTTLEAIFTQGIE